MKGQYIKVGNCQRKNGVILMGERVPNHNENLARDNRLYRLIGSVTMASSLSLLPACSYFEEPKSDAAVIIQMSCKDAKTGSPTPPIVDFVYDRQTANSDSGMYEPDVSRTLCQPGSILSGTPDYRVITPDEYNRDDLSSNQIAVHLKGVLGQDKYVATFGTHKDDEGRANGVTLGTNATAAITAIEGIKTPYHAEGK